MLFPLSELIGDPDDLICINRTDLVSEALEIMSINDFTQLPVIDDEGFLIGTITENSILKSYQLLGDGESLLSLPVEHCQAKAVTIEPERDLFEALELLKTVYAIIVVEDRKPVGILTDYDTTNFFRNYSEGLILVQDVELTLRYYIEAILHSDDLLDGALVRAFDVDKRNPSRPAREYSQLSFWNHVVLITENKNWMKFEEYLKPKSVFVGYMESVRDVRNQIAHFRDQMDVVQKQSLEHALHWITCRPKVVTDQKPRIIQREELPDRKDPIRSKHGKYFFLRDWLENDTDFSDNIELTFIDIEMIIRDELPESARKHRAWWGNHYHNAQAKSWLEAGWVVDDVDLNLEHVVFRRTRKALYPGFFFDLISTLKKDRPGITRASKVSMDNWFGFSAGTSGFTYAWVLPKEPVLRVELFIDTGDLERNNRSFNYLYSRMSVIEDMVGEKINWDRLPNAQSCRVSISKPYELEDPQEDHDQVKAWGVKMMLRFVDAFTRNIKNIDLNS